MIDILMATYNGSLYISEQINSILNQTHQEFKLIIQDDCSSDNTFDILKKYQDKYPDKIILYKRETPTGSAVSNFMDMLKYATADYIMFADQDDIWDIHKIELSYKAMREQEQIYGTDTPVLIHTDLFIVNENKQILSNSFFKNEHLTPDQNFKKLLIGNYVTGCTMLINRMLLNLAVNIDTTSVYMHDWMLALIASCFGQLYTLPISTIYYRQHSANQVGASKKHTIFSCLDRLINTKKRNEFITLYKKAYSQAQVLNQINYPISESRKKYLQQFIQIMQYKKIKKMVLLSKHHYLSYYWLKAIEQLLFT